MSEAPVWGDPPWRVGGTIPESALPERCELAVVGGGLTGLACAWTAARAGAHTVLLEARRIGAGASGRTGGIVLEGTAAGPVEGLGDCIAHLEALVEELGIDCGLELGGCWELRHEPQAESERPGWTDEGGRLVVEATVPGGTLDPGALIAGLARAAIGAGACVVENTPVRSIEWGDPLTLPLGNGRLLAERVVTGLNGFTPSLLPDFDQVRSALSLALATEPLDRETLDAVGAEAPFYTIDLPYLWGRPLPGGRLLYGGGIASDPAEAPEAVRLLETRVRGLHPALAHVRTGHRWGGPVAFRQGRLPLLSPTARSPHAIVTGAYAGHGVALALRIGQLAARAALAGEPLPSWGAL